MAAETLSEKSQKALALLEDSLAYHQQRVATARKHKEAFDGIMDPKQAAAYENSRLHPPYVKHITETALAGLIDEKLSYRVKPSPKFYEADELQLAIDGAKAHEFLHRYQLARDRFHEKQRPFALQNAIAGTTIAKTFWRSEVRKKRRLGFEEVVPGLSRPVESEFATVVYDGPVTEVVNLEDVFWHESAMELQRSPFFCHRVWMTYVELEQAQRQGIYSNISELKGAKGQAESGEALVDVDGRMRTKDMIEVSEIWWKEPDGIWVVTLGNRSVEIRSPRRNPFWHGEYPFVGCSTQPDLFKIPGYSQVEKIAHLQQAAWDMLNQTHENVRYINNFIMAINTTMVEDPDALQHAPGERWPVEGPVDEAIKVFQPSTITAEVALPHIRMLQQDMQDLAGGHPFTSTSEAGKIGADTATEAALVANLAQLSIRQQRSQLYYAYERIGQQRTELNQQFLRSPVTIPDIGLDEEYEQREISPELLSGDYVFDITPMSESLMRSEKRAEANTLLQMFLKVAMPLYELSKQGMATAPNADAYVKHWLEQFDLDPQIFMSAKKPAPQMALPGAAGANGQQQAAGGEPPLGITAPQATDPTTSPSDQMSVSPEMHMQRLLAMRGGVSNVA